MSAPTPTPHSDFPHDAEAVADMLDTLAAADRHLAAELDRIASSRSPVNLATVRALEQLLATLRPAAAVRAQLAGVDVRVLGEALRLRRTRRQLHAIPGGAR